MRHWGKLSSVIARWKGYSQFQSSNPPQQQPLHWGPLDAARVEEGVVGLLDSISFRFLIGNRLILLVNLSGERRKYSPFPPQTMTSFPYRPRFNPFSSASFAESSTAKTCALGEEDTDKLDIPRGRKAFAFSESVYQLSVPL